MVHYCLFSLITDTMDPERGGDNQPSAGPSRRSGTDQPDQSASRIPGISPVLTNPVVSVKNNDYTDGPIHVQVAKCSRQFYNDHRNKVCIHLEENKVCIHSEFIEKNNDDTDCPINVYVAKCSQQFYNDQGLYSFRIFREK